MKNIFTNKRWPHIIALLIMLFSINAYSENNEQQQNQVSRTVTLVVSGEGTTKEEATNNALRSAIEQTFGTFVSANTEVLNDEIIKDQIATVSSGNIESYKVLSSVNAGSMKRVNIQAIVSIGKLISFAKSHGMKAELSGAAFAMNMKMKELNRQNEQVAIDNMYRQLDLMAENSNLFDYKINTGEPYQGENGRYIIPVTIEVLENENTFEFFKLCAETVQSLALNNAEISEYKRSNNLKCFQYRTYLGNFYLRNKYPRYLNWSNYYIQLSLQKSLSKFRIVDNLNNVVYFGMIKTDDLLTKYNEGLQLLFVRSYDGENQESYSMVFASKNVGCTKRSSNDLQFRSIIFDTGKMNNYPLKFNLDLSYTSEDFMKLSSINVVPVSNVIYFK